MADFLHGCKFPVSQNEDGRFYFDSEGNPYPSVTTILRVIADKDWEQFRGAVGNDRVDEVLENASRRGTAVHKMVEAHIKGENAETEDAEVQACFGLFRKWFDERVKKVIALEYGMMGMGYAGTVDLICETHDGDIYICDLKTSAKLKDVHWLQLSALYQLALEDERLQEIIYDLQCDGGMVYTVIVHCQKNLKKANVVLCQGSHGRANELMEVFNAAHVLYECLMWPKIKDDFI